MLTGGPSAGKTSLLTLLAFLGHRVLPETARLLIDVEMSHGRSVAAVREDAAAFQQRILELKVQAEERLPPGECVFLDRGLPDTLAYCRALGLDETAARTAVARGPQYRVVFLLEQLTYEPDYARTEDEVFARRLAELLVQVYQELGYMLVRVPWLPLDDRADFILRYVD